MAAPIYAVWDDNRQQWFSPNDKCGWVSQRAARCAVSNAHGKDHDRARFCVFRIKGPSSRMFREDGGFQSAVTLV